MSREVNLGILAVILVVSFVLRLYKITAPLADWHSWRQADTAAVARNFVKEGIDLLHPQYDDLSNIASGRENPQGYRMVEFPIYAFFHASLFKIFPMLSFEMMGRLLSALFSLGTIVFLFLIVKELAGISLALLSAFFYAILPFNIYYNRVILPEPMMVASSLGAIYFFIKGLRKAQSAKLKVQNHSLKLKTFLLFLTSVVFLSIASLLKPFALFLILPPILYLTFQCCLETNKKNYWIIWLFGYLAIGLLPFLLWRTWIQQFPEGIPANLWLLNGDGIRFKGAWFYWLFAERLGKLILGYWGLVFFVLGLLAKPSKKEGCFFYFWLLGCLAYLSVVATGNVRHDYYQILIIPVICFFLAKGVFFLLENSGKFFRGATRYLLLATCFLFMEAFAWYQVRNFFNINHPEIVQAGQQVEKLSKEGERVIAPYGGDTAFLYQTGRKGWPIGGQIEEKIKKGAVFYVSVKFDEEALDLIQRCPVLQKEESFVIISLKDCHF